MTEVNEAAIRIQRLMSISPGPGTALSYCMSVSASGTRFYPFFRFDSVKAANDHDLPSAFRATAALGAGFSSQCCIYQNPWLGLIFLPSWASTPCVQCDTHLGIRANFSWSTGINRSKGNCFRHSKNARMLGSMMPVFANKSAGIANTGRQQCM